jgi:hypothetical protein
MPADPNDLDRVGVEAQEIVPDQRLRGKAAPQFAQSPKIAIEKGDIGDEWRITRPEAARHMPELAVAEFVPPASPTDLSEHSLEEDHDRKR